VEVELLSAWEALKHEHSELHVAAKLVCDALGVNQVHLMVGSLRSRLGVTFEQVQTQVKETLHLGMWCALAVFRSHY
jgi:hypothetical protein